MDIKNSNIGSGPKGRKALRRRVSGLTRDAGKASAFKIGITNNYNRRASQYGDAYDEMIVLFTTNDLAEVRSLESDLVFDYSFAVANDNLTGGGGGPAGRPPFYLYLVRRAESTAWAGGGVVAGAAGGALLGLRVGGPLGALVGGLFGGLTGALLDEA